MARKPVTEEVPMDTPFDDPAPQHVLRQEGELPDLPIPTTAQYGEKSVTLQVGPFVFSPVAYNTFTVGPFKLVVPLNPANDIFAKANNQKAILAGMEVLKGLFKEEYRNALKFYSWALDFNDRAVKEFMAQRQKD